MINILYLLAFVLLSTSVLSQTQLIVINEFLASNSSVNSDPDFHSNSDWIEVFNPQDTTVNLNNWFLTDDLDNPQKWQITGNATIPAGEFLIFWADEQDVILSNYHTNFKLSKNGEEIGLFNPNQVLVDNIVYENQTTDISFGRQPDGGADWFSFDDPTHSESNNTTIFLKADAPQFSLPAGYYTENQVLEISVDDSSQTIRYTTDGNEPTSSSTIYTEPLMIASRVGEENVFSMIQTNIDPYSWLPDWLPPAGEVFKANVVRARAFKDGFYPSDIISKTYFVDENMYQRYATMPVISLISDYNNLFDDNTGIYIPGNSGQNYFEDWEKPAHIEYFEPDGALGFAQDVGIKIQGGTSPASPQKGLHVIARSEYGNNRINYPLFKNDPSKAKELVKFKRFMLRAWGSIIGSTLFGDAYSHRLMAKNNLDIQAYKPVIVFINGEYWGLHELREANKNSWYYEYHYDIDHDSPGVDILQHTGGTYPRAEEGDANHWNNMMAFLNTHDMTLPENYEYLKTQIDMENFITYLGHCMYLGKWDWPNNNDASWRPRTEDGKWRWIQYDMETGLGVATELGPMFQMLGPKLNMVQAVTVGLEIPGFGTYGPHPIVAKIYKNNEFMDSLSSWIKLQMEHEFSPDSMNNLLDEMAAELRPYMQEFEHRAPYIAGMNDGWENALEHTKEFINLRPEHMLSHLENLSSIDEFTPLDYKLYQNYPNPFNPTTVIQFTLQASQKVELSVYDVLGKKVAELLNRNLSAGSHFVTFNATNMSSGVYIYKISTSNFSTGPGFNSAKKLLLLK